MSTAYGPDGRYGGFYTQDDVREIVAAIAALPAIVYTVPSANPIRYSHVIESQPVHHASGAVTTAAVGPPSTAAAASTTVPPPPADPATAV